MATKFITQPPIPSSHVFLSHPIKMMKLDAAASLLLATHNKPIIRYKESLSPSPSSYRRCSSHSSIEAAQDSFESATDADIVITEQETRRDYRTIAQIKQDLYAALQGINRGIFGVQSEKRTKIENLVKLLESQNSTSQPTLCLEKAARTWKLIYSTISILGAKRTKLGLRDFITLGDFLQYINVAESKEVNVIKFSAKGLKRLSGQLMIDASFKIASESRVDISYDKSVITPDQLMNVFRKNYDLLLQIFNLEGWLEITYVDDSLRIGRDDKGNIFVLERLEDNNL